MIDVLIIGGGPSGLTAALYAARNNLKTVVVEKVYVGGQMSLTMDIQNYPSVDKTTGIELAEKMKAQAEAFGASVIYAEVEKLELSGKTKKAILSNGDTLEARSIILCMGAATRKLGVAEEDRFIGAGVSYCATCDGALFRGKDVAVVGGGNTALEDVLYLAELAKSVTLIHRRASFRADSVLVERISAKANVNIVTDARVAALSGEGRLKEIEVDTLDGKRRFEVSGLFVAVGQNPSTGLVDGIIVLTSDKYIITNEDMATNLGGVFAAGDIRSKSLRQIVTAAADGAIAASSAARYLSEQV